MCHLSTSQYFSSEEKFSWLLRCSWLYSFVTKGETDVKLYFAKTIQSGIKHWHICPRRPGNSGQVFKHSRTFKLITWSMLIRQKKKNPNKNLFTLHWILAPLPVKVATFCGYLDWTRSWGCRCYIDLQSKFLAATLHNLSIERSH